MYLSQSFCWLRQPALNTVLRRSQCTSQFQNPMCLQLHVDPSCDVKLKFKASMVASVLFAWSINECKHNKICKYGDDYNFHKQVMVEASWDWKKINWTINCIQFEDIPWHLDLKSAKKTQEFWS